MNQIFPQGHQYSVHQKKIVDLHWSQIQKIEISYDTSLPPSTVQFFQF